MVVFFRLLAFLLLRQGLRVLQPKITGVRQARGLLALFAAEAIRPGAWGCPAGDRGTSAFLIFGARWREEGRSFSPFENGQTDGHGAVRAS